MRVQDDYTFNLVGKKFRLPSKSAKKLNQHYIYKGGSLAFYHPETRKINIVKYKTNELLEYAEGMNYRTGAILHRSGFKLRPRRSIKQEQKMLFGFEKINTASDFYSRIISHESLHKALHNIGELKASMELDNLIG